MTTIKASCPGCGEIELTAAEILLRIGAAHAVNSYGFSCPKCVRFVEKPADDHIVKLLLAGGVMPVVIVVPAEALEKHDGPPITHDDLLSFHEMLEAEGWLEALTRGRRHSQSS